MKDNFVAKHLWKQNKPKVEPDKKQDILETLLDKELECADNHYHEQDESLPDVGCGNLNVD